MAKQQLIDKFQRPITYLRLSVTDRCDFRCLYCMAEDMTFLPRKDVLNLEELARIAQVFSELGVKKIRVTGGEPLIRKDVLKLFEALGKLELEQLCLSTNGSNLKPYAHALVDAGVTSVNISIDSLQEKRFKKLTRYGNLDEVLAGIDAAIDAGFKRIKLNSVLLRNFNLDEAHDLAQFALEKKLDISFIEEMPLGEIHSHSRHVEYISSEDLRSLLSGRFTLSESSEHTGGPSRYWNVKGFKNKIGFISPHSENFCASCNRVRVSASGRLLLCLGNEHSVDLRQILRDNLQNSPQNSPQNNEALKQAIIESMNIKPEKHHFDIQNEPQIVRFMNATGG